MAALDMTYIPKERRVTFPSFQISGVSDQTLDTQSRNFDTSSSKNPLRRDIRKSLQEICNFVLRESKGFQESHYKFESNQTVS